MATYKTRGIVLLRQNFFEADRIITILTKFRGKLRILAKGVRKQLSKNGGAIELFLLSDFLLAEGRNFDILASAQIIKSFAGIRNDLKKTAIAYQIAELTDKILVENQEHNDIYNLCKRTLSYLNRVNLSNQNLIFEFYAFQAVSAVGFSPQLQTCVNCGQKLEPDKNYFSPREGGILCPKCGQSDKIGIEITPNQIKLLRIFLDRDISILSKVEIKNNDIKALKKIIDYYLKYVIEKELKSEAFVKKVCRTGQGD